MISINNIEYVFIHGGYAILSMCKEKTLVLNHKITNIMVKNIKSLQEQVFFSWFCATLANLCMYDGNPCVSVAD